jgi:hypothetical protein
LEYFATKFLSLCEQENHSDGKVRPVKAALFLRQSEELTNAEIG